MSVLLRAGRRALNELATWAAARRVERELDLELDFFAAEAALAGAIGQARTADGTPLILLRSPSTKTGRPGSH